MGRRVFRGTVLECGQTSVYVLGRHSFWPAGCSMRLDHLFGAGRTLVSLGLLAYLMGMMDWPKAAHALSLIEPVAYAVAPAGFTFALYIAAVRWHFVLRAIEVRLAVAQAFALYLVGSFYNVLLPGVIGGDLVRVGLCANRVRTATSEILVTVIVERALGLLALVLMGSGAVWMLSASTRALLGPGISYGLPVVGCLAVIGLLVALLAARSKSGFLAGLGFLRNPMARFGGALRRISGVQPGALLLWMLLSSLFQLCDIVVTRYCGLLVGLEFPLSVYVAVVPLVYLVTVLPISLGGLGVREGAFVYLLSRLGADPSDAVLLAFLVYLNRVMVGVVGFFVDRWWRLGPPRG